MFADSRQTPPMSKNTPVTEERIDYHKNGVVYKLTLLS